MDWLDWVFPKKCIGCGKMGGYVCGECNVGLWEEEQICPVCRRNSRYGERHGYCKDSYGLDGLTCLWAYEGIAKKIIKKAKYKFYYDLLGELIVESPEFIERPEFGYFLKILEGRSVVVPVPLHPARERERGFNQADTIGRSFAERHSLSFNGHLLERIRDTGHQTGRTREERLLAVRGAFQISNLKSQIPNRVLLVDDVWTTGATMSECCKILKQNGAKNVWGLVLAR